MLPIMTGTMPMSTMRGNQGWSTAGRAGRPRLASPADSKMRPQHAIRAYAEEWEVIKRFVALAKQDLQKAREIVENS